eukprot:Clim_evm56s77 gene=Clim_evmTU56s77
MLPVVHRTIAAKTVGSRGNWYHFCRYMSKMYTTDENKNDKDENWRSKIPKIPPGFSPAVVKDISQPTPTVKVLKMYTTDLRFSFKPGQWVDFYIPYYDEDVVAGFSMCSTPRLLQTRGMFDLAIKRSRHRPATWVHEQCTPGAEVFVRSGGTFYVDNYASADLLLLAGGVGINPIVSIFKHSIELGSDGPKRMALIYSASSLEEMLFYQEIVSVLEKVNARNIPPIEVHLDLRVTRDAAAKDLRAPHISQGRINGAVLREALSRHDISACQVYLCGPPAMAEHLHKLLNEESVTDKQIHYEKWW